jgi:nucleotide-binding universal stress UspA family protein
MVMTQVSGGSGVQMPGIIVGVDGSAHSQWALEWAVHEGMARRAEVTALSVHHQWAVTCTEGDPSLDQAVEEVQALAGKVAGCRPGPVPPVTVRVIVGSPAAELMSAARGADLLVVGSRGGRGFGRRGLGSVSSRVAYEAPCPVIIIFQPTSTHLSARRAAVNRTGTRRLLALAAAAGAASRP